MSTQPFDPARYKAGQRWEWDTAAPRLKDWGPFLVHQLQPVSERMLKLADIQPASRVLDMATGGGEPAVTAAHRVGPSGHVLAIDLSPQMIALGRERAAELGLHNIDFREMDAEAPDLPEHSFDVIHSRFGLMFLPDPRWRCNGCTSCWSLVGGSSLPSGALRTRSPSPGGRWKWRCASCRYQRLHHRCLAPLVWRTIAEAAGRSTTPDGRCHTENEVVLAVGQREQTSSRSIQGAESRV